MQGRGGVERGCKTGLQQGLAKANYHRTQSFTPPSRRLCLNQCGRCGVCTQIPSRSSNVQQGFGFVVVVEVLVTAGDIYF